MQAEILSFFPCFLSNPHMKRFDRKRLQRRYSNAFHVFLGALTGSLFFLLFDCFFLTGLYANCLKCCRTVNDGLRIPKVRSRHPRRLPENRPTLLAFLSLHNALMISRRPGRHRWQTTSRRYCRAKLARLQGMRQTMRQLAQAIFLSICTRLDKRYIYICTSAFFPGKDG